MLSRARALRRPALRLEPLEDRLVLSPYRVALDPILDRYGDQIGTVQAYEDSSRLAYGIFDTGSSVITFAADDQARFVAAGTPIPIKVPNGAVATGVGGDVTGDVSEPGNILVDGLHAATLTYDENGLPTFTASFSTGAAASGVQVFVGTEAGSPAVPTITGMPILRPSSSNPSGRAALVELEGAGFDFSPSVPGLQVGLPDLRFVEPGTALPGREGTSGPIRLPMSLIGGSGTLGANGVTQSPNPVSTDVRLSNGVITISGRRFLFDTGAQMSVVSPWLAEQLQLHPNGPGSQSFVQGIGGSAQLTEVVAEKLQLGDAVEFTNVPLFVADLENGLDGILGMNLFNSAVAMLIDPYGGGDVTVLFASQEEHGLGVPAGQAGSMQQIGVPFATQFNGTSLPAITVASGQISGSVIIDANDDGSLNATESGLGNQIVYVDANDNGRLDDGEKSAVTASDGSFTINGLLPGTYTVRQVVPAGYVQLSPRTDVTYRVNVGSGSNNGGWTFGVVPVSPDETTAYVAGLYGTVLGRTPDAGGQTYWVGRLRAGVSRQSVSQQFWESPEHRGLQVQRYYAVYLQRAADDAGREAWVQAFRSGASEIDVQLGFLTSSEYLNAHRDPYAFVTGLYVDLLQRTPDAGGQAFWVASIQERGASYRQVARGVLTSLEGYMRALDRYYEDFLHRPADTTGALGWANALTRNQLSLESAALGFLVSQEFRDRQRARLG